jgi:RimJ/RimL family protein N-acetyltransferase
VEIPRDHQQLVEFLCNDEWPFHGRRQLTPADIHAMDFSSADVASFWIVDTGETIGLVRLLDLGDIGSGAPLFDLRIASRYRGCGFGKRAARWIVDHLFTSYPELHRIEANTRADNTAMQRVLSAAGFTPEGVLRLAWPGEEGHWFDTMIYGILRSEWPSADNGQAAS